MTSLNFGNLLIICILNQSLYLGNIFPWIMFLVGNGTRIKSSGDLKSIIPMLSMKSCVCLCMCLLNI